jgi:hypothetical protein
MLMSRVRVTFNGALDWWLDLVIHFNTQLITTLNYSAIADLHTLQFARAHSLVFLVCY